MRYETITEIITKELRDRILRESILPGEKINVDELAKDMQVSKTPIREALRKLEKEELLIFIPRRGWEVKKLSNVEVKNLYEVQELLETFLVRNIDKYIDSISIDNLKRINEQLNEAVLQRDFEEVICLNQLFHIEIYKYYPNNNLHVIINNAWNQFSQHRLHMVSADIYLQNVIKQHDQMIEGIAERDFPRLELLCYQHYRLGEEAMGIEKTDTRF
ncbi:MAG: GntR family transcriptional regulator [Dehalobacterium sp.]